MTPFLQQSMMVVAVLSLFVLATKFLLSNKRCKKNALGEIFYDVCKCEDCNYYHDLLHVKHCSCFQFLKIAGIFSENTQYFMYLSEIF